MYQLNLDYVKIGAAHFKVGVQLLAVTDTPPLELKWVWGHISNIWPDNLNMQDSV